MIYNAIYFLFSTIGFYLASVNTQNNTVSTKRKLSIFLSLYLIMFLFFPYWGQISTLLCVCITIILLTWKNTHKVQTIISFLTGYLLVVCIDYLSSTLAFTISGLTIEELREDYLFLLTLFYIPLIYFLTRLARYVLYQKIRIQDQHPGRLTFMVLLNLAVSAVIFIILIIVGDELGYPPNVVIFNFILFFLYFLSSVLLLYFTGKTIQKDSLLKLELIQHENLTNYIKEVERLNSEMRAFRHDYIDLLVTMKEYIDQENIDSLKTFFYREILPASRGVASSDYHLGMLSRIKIDSLKSLLAAKLISAHEKNIHIHLEITQNIEHLSIPVIDLVRILGIFLTNAIEAAEESKEKEIALAFIREGETITILIRNTTPPLNYSIQQLKMPGISTKDGHSGIGLDTACKILDRYNNVQWKIDYDNKYFLIKIQIG